MSGGSPLGGTYSGPGVTGNNFDASTAGLGSHPITYTYSDLNGCVNSATNSITVTSLPVVSLATAGPFCIDATAVQLVGSPVGGTYSGSGVSVTGLFTPATAGAGSHVITYTYTSGSCTGTATTTINVNALPTITVTTSATCSTDLLTYSVGVTVSSGTVTSTSGTVNNIGGNLWSINSIPTGTPIILTVTDGNSCLKTLPVTAPDCNCPVIAPPVSGGDKAYCSGNSIPAITASVLAGETVDWYSGATGGSALATGTTSYTPLSAGTYYAEARNTTTNCKSSIRTQITITVNTLPVPVITGPATACVNSMGNVYSTTAGMTNYTWVVSAGGIITSGGGSSNNTVTVTWNTASGQTVSVNYTNSNSCIAAIPTVYNVTVSPLPVPVITGPATACVNSTGNVYSTTAGMTNYTWVVSAGGTITSGGGSSNSTVTVTWNTASGQTVSVNYTNSNGCTASAQTVYNVTIDDCFKTLNLTSVMLQGLYNSGGTMRQASNGSGPRWPDGSADHITVELHSAGNYLSIVYSATDVPLSTAGNATVSVPASNNGSYYITIKHRNSLETTTYTAISFAGNIINQSFGSRASVYGNNLGSSLDGHYLIYGGDVNHDGIVDTGDMNDVDNGSTAILFGYNSADANGDGIVDTSDMNIVDNNSTAIVIVRLPH